MKSWKNEDKCDGIKDISCSIEKALQKHGKYFLEMCGNPV